MKSAGSEGKTSGSRFLELEEIGGKPEDLPEMNPTVRGSSDTREFIVYTNGYRTQWPVIILASIVMVILLALLVSYLLIKSLGMQQSLDEYLNTSPPTQVTVRTEANSLESHGTPSYPLKTSPGQKKLTKNSMNLSDTCAFNQKSPRRGLSPITESPVFWGFVDWQTVPGAGINDLSDGLSMPPDPSARTSEKEKMNRIPTIDAARIHAPSKSIESRGPFPEFAAEQRISIGDGFISAGDYENILVSYRRSPKSQRHDSGYSSGVDLTGDTRLRKEIHEVLHSVKHAVEGKNMDRLQDCFDEAGAESVQRQLAKAKKLFRYFEDISTAYSDIRIEEVDPNLVMVDLHCTITASSRKGKDVVLFDDEQVFTLSRVSDGPWKISAVTE